MTDMKKLLRALTPLMLAATAAGCGGGDTGGEGGAAGGGGGGAPAAPAFDMATAGHVTGMVMLEGAAPANEPIDMASESVCAAKHSTPPTTEDFKVSADGHLADVFVYVKSGATDGMTFPVPSEPVVIDQNGCQYIPHVSGVMAGQTLRFRNSDGVLHNISGSPSTNRPFNFGMPGAVQTMDRELTSPEVMIPVECDVHGWMYSFVGVTAHPYHAVSNAGGTFDLRNLPPGTYVIEAWHSRLGVQEQTVTVATGQTAQVTFTFNAANVANAVVPMGAPIDPHDHGPVALGEGGAAHAHETVAAGS